MNNRIELIELMNKENQLWRPISCSFTKEGSGKKIKKNLLADLQTGARPKLDDFRDPKWVKNKMKSLQKLVVGNQYNMIAVDTFEVYHLDIDWEEGKGYTPKAKAIIEDLLKICPYYKSTTKKLGKHLLFRSKQKISKYTLKLYSKPNKDLEYEDLEILAGNWGWAKKQTIVENYNGEIPVLDLEDYDFINSKNIKVGEKKTIKMKIKKNPISISTIEPPEKTTFFQKMELISIDVLNDYDNWLKILFSIKSYDRLSVEEGYKIAKFISSKSQKFDINEFNNKWANIQPSSNITIGTALYFAKASNPMRYKELCIQEMREYDLDFLDSDSTLASIYLRDNSQDIVNKNGNLYTFISNREGSDEGRWVLDKSKNTLKYNVGTYLSTLFDGYRQKEEAEKNKYKEGADEEDLDKYDECSKKLDWLYKLQAKIKNVAKINSVVEKLLHNISIINYDNINFDTNGYLLAFNNRVYDLESHNWVNCLRNNYILTTTGYDWDEPTEEEYSKVEQLFEDIFEKKSIRAEFVHYLATCLYGIPVEKFIIANGDGGNGKGVLSELMAEALGNYYYSGNNAVLLQPLKSGGNPEIANMEYKRMVVYKEPSEHRKLDLSVIKALTGGDEIPARKLHSNETKVKLCATHILEVNKKLGLNGDTGNSIKRRLRDIPFETEFTTDKEVLSDKNLKFVKKADTYFKSITFKERHKCAIIKYLIEYCVAWEEDTEFNNGEDRVVDRFYEAKEVDERTLAYIENNDNILTFLKSKYIETKDTDNDYFKLADFYSYFKLSDFYLNLTKAERNGEYSKKSLISYFKSKAKLRKYYKERQDRTGEKWADLGGYGKNLKNIVIGWRMRNDTELEEASDDEELDYLD